VFSAIYGQIRSFLKLRCDERFTHAFTACGSIFKVITLVDSNQGNYFENATASSKRMRKTTVAMQLKATLHARTMQYALPIKTNLFRKNLKIDWSIIKMFLQIL